MCIKIMALDSSYCGQAIVGSLEKQLFQCCLSSATFSFYHLLNFSSDFYCLSWGFGCTRLSTIFQMSGPTEMVCWPMWCDTAVCRMSHRAPGSSPPLVGLATGQVVPGTGVWWGRERSGLTGAGRALRHSTVLLCGRTIVWVTLTSIHFLVTEVDAEYLPRCLPLATGYWALESDTYSG